jgi:dihydrofolate reductase|tara:strand:- start:228 stop:764 length:537 start_codon:yes stop_codon:yes gene_type:complete
MKKIVSLIIACTLDGGIGNNNKIPWNIKDDMLKFRKITMETDDKSKKNALIMGSRTYMSLPVKKLKNRINIVISRTDENNKIYQDNDVLKFSLIDIALNYCYNNDNIEKIYVIGGSYLYNYFLENNKLIDLIYLSIIKDNYECDTSVNIVKIFKNFKLEKDITYMNNDYVSYICYNKI